MERQQREKATYDIDLCYPINLEEIDMSKGDCFGVMYDIRSKECPMCADNEICSIVFMKNGLKDKINKQQKEDGIEYLDECRLNEIDQDWVYDCIDSGVTTISSFVVFIQTEGKTSDVYAVKEWVKRFKEKYNLSIVQGVIWKK